jgi:hypothetical protein
MSPRTLSANLCFRRVPETGKFLAKILFLLVLLFNLCVREWLNFVSSDMREDKRTFRVLPEMLHLLQGKTRFLVQYLVGLENKLCVFEHFRPIFASFGSRSLALFLI